MANVNRVVVSGNLTRDPELRQLAGGNSVCKLRIAVNTRKKDFVCGMRLGRNGSFGNHYYSGIRPQAGRFLAINRASAAAVKGA